MSDRKITNHQYVDAYPIKPTDEILILGTIHPHNVEEFKMPFFYGNRNSIWNSLRDAFPEEIPSAYTIEDIKAFLRMRNIAVSDTILSCERIDNSALDRKLIPIVLNTALVDQIKRSNINRIYCTSGFGKNNAFRLFYERILGLKLTKEIRTAKRVVLPADIFGREVIVTILPSPSGAANISLSKSVGYTGSTYFGQLESPVYRYKVSL